MQSIQRRLGDRIRKLRVKKGWTQEDIAEISGLRRTYIGAVERGEKNLTLTTPCTISKTLGTTIANLLQGIG